VDLFNAAVKGDQELATKHQEMHDKISTLYQGAGRTLGQSLATLKMILKHLGLGEGGMIPPLTMLDANEEEKVRIKVLEWIEAGHLERLGD
jgi:dihydrodipicolinate synthase/N-acetylneuraminate lyase